MSTKLAPSGNTQPGKTQNSKLAPKGSAQAGKTQNRLRHVPQRTCIACRRHDNKRGLVRIVRTPQGTLEVDETGKKNGRGAYLCRARECWETGLNRKALDNALKVTIDPESRARLKSYGESLPGRSAADVE